jgi:hypothetical protein
LHVGDGGGLDDPGGRRGGAVLAVAKSGDHPPVMAASVEDVGVGADLGVA